MIFLFQLVFSVVIINALYKKVVLYKGEIGLRAGNF